MAGEPSFSQSLSFDHDGQLELSGVFLFFNVVGAFVIGAPWGAWIALKRRGYEPPRWPTVVALLIIAPVLGMFAFGQVPSAPAIRSSSPT
jgi:hypothetical protein